MSLLSPQTTPNSILNKALAGSYFNRGWVDDNGAAAIHLVQVFLRVVNNYANYSTSSLSRDPPRSRAGSLLGYCSVVAYKSRSAIIMSHHPTGDIVLYVKSWRLLEWLDDGGDFCMSDETKDSFCSTASLLTNNNNHVHSTAIPCLVWYMDGLCVSNDLISLEDGKSFRVMHCFPRMRRRWRRTWVDKRHEWQLFVKDANRPCLLPCLVKWWLSHESVNYGLLDGVRLQGIKYADKKWVGGTIKTWND